MYPCLIHIYGPLCVYSYGFMLALGFLVFLYCTLKHPLRKKIISPENYLNVVFAGLLAGIIGGRILFILTEWHSFSGHWIEIFYPWVGGLVALGSILGVLIVIPFYLNYLKVPIFPLLDLTALYAPLIQMIARIGCFLAGCCYGAPAQGLAWTVTFTHPESAAPINIPLHPTQLYTSLSFLFIFFIMQVLATKVKKPGQLLFSYLLCENVTRFTIDFWRNDRGDLYTMLNLSQYQLLSIAVFIIAAVGLVWVSLKTE